MAKLERERAKSRRYIAALALTVLVFAVGLLFGIFLDSQRANYVKDESNRQRVEYNSLQLQYELLNEIMQGNDCGSLLRTFESNVKNLESTRIRLEQYQQDSAVNVQDFELLSREYSIAQIRYYMLAKKTRELCGNDVVTALYFFSDAKSCPDCDSQAFILTYLKKLMGDKMLVFSFNANLADQEQSIAMLRDLYNVTTYPSIVVNDKRHEGLVQTNVALAAVCGEFKQEYDFCK